MKLIGNRLKIRYSVQNTLVYTLWSSVIYIMRRSLEIESVWPTDLKKIMMHTFKILIPRNLTHLQHLITKCDTIGGHTGVFFAIPRDAVRRIGGNVHL